MNNLVQLLACVINVSIIRRYTLCLSSSLFLSNLHVRNWGWVPTQYSMCEKLYNYSIKVPKYALIDLRL
jgi:hypothetical protein